MRLSGHWLARRVRPSEAGPHAQHHPAKRESKLGKSYTDPIYSIYSYIDIRYPHDWRGRHPQFKQWFDGIAARKSFEETFPPGFIRP
jgi:hypothetical protein